MDDAQAPTFVLDHDQIKCIRTALLVGLESYAETERLQHAVSLYEMTGRELPSDELRPLHPTGSAETLCEFVAALRYLNLEEVQGESS